MRTLWNALSFMAVVNLLVLSLFGGWLWKTQRLDRGRIEEIRKVLATTVPDAAAAAEQAAREAESQQQRQADEARRLAPPLPSAEQVRAATEDRSQVDQSSRRLDEQHRQLTDQVAAAMAELDRRRSALEADERAWETRKAEEVSRRTDAQFAKAVKLLESLPPKQAKQRLMELVSAGSVDQAVSYLDAMSDRAAGKVLSEFKDDTESRLATELLERLRTFGLPGAPPDSSSADSLATNG